MKTVRDVTEMQISLSGSYRVPRNVPGIDWDISNEILLRSDQILHTVTETVYCYNIYTFILKLSILTHDLPVSEVLFLHEENIKTNINILNTDR